MTLYKLNELKLNISQLNKQKDQNEVSANKKNNPPKPSIPTMQ